jgi:signal transduction histidine kinase
MMHGFRAFGGFGGFRDLQVAVPLPDGQWLSFATALPESGSTFSRQFLLSMGIMAIVIVVVSVWAVRSVTAPLAAVSTAAERLGKDLNAPPMPETGTIETRQAARAFNTMQARLRSLIENRTRMLAAISHDLRTPLTLLRLRAENVENHQERDKMLGTIAEMDSMVGETLQFARNEATSEQRHPTDISALVQSIVDDMADAGLSVQMQPAEPIVYDCHPDALKRAIRNVLDNAAKYGKAASVAIQTTPKTIKIIIDDEGPGFLNRSSRGCSTRSTVLRITKPRDWRSWPRLGDRAVDRTGPPRRANTDKSTVRRPARQTIIAALRPERG